MFTKTENHLSNQACNRTSGEPCAVKVASTVRRGGIGKVLRQLACSLPNQAAVETPAIPVRCPQVRRTRLFKLPALRESGTW